MARGCATRGLRVEVDDRAESVGRKIREAELRKVPYMLVVGDTEAEAGAVAVRRHGHGDLGASSLPDLVASMTSQVRDRTSAAAL